MALGKITYADKETGDQVTATDINQIKSVVNFLVDRVFWADYNDGGTNNAIAFTAGNAIQLGNDKAGPFTNESFLPNDITTLWDVSTGFDFSELSIGDIVGIRFDIETTLNVNNQTGKVFLRVAEGSASEFDIPIMTQSQFKDSGVKLMSEYTEIYIGSADVRDNPAHIYFESDGAGSVKVNGWFVKVIKR